MIRGAFTDPELKDRTVAYRDKYGLTCAIETGTYLGESAKILAEIFEKVYTIEIDPDVYKQADHLKSVSNLTRLIGSSTDHLSRILSIEKRPFIFLDAHWYEWPLRTELSIIKESKVLPVLAIHDFFVPDSNGAAKFGYDAYNGIKNEWSYIEDLIRAIYGDNFFSEYSTTSTTNSGVIYICPLQA